MPVEVKPLFTGILDAGRHEVYTCPNDKRAAVLIVRVKNKAPEPIGVSVDGNWNDEAGDIEQFPDNYEVLPGHIACDFNFKLFFDGGGKLIVRVATGGLIHCYIGGFERPI